MSRHLLFVCGKNRLRSPTAEQIFANWPGVETASAGLNNDAESPVTPELVEWAHTIFVMERAQRTKLSSRFRPYLTNKRVICLNIPDEFEFMDPKLIQLFNAKVSRHLPSP